MSLKVGLKVSHWSQSPSLEGVKELQDLTSSMRVFGEITPRKSDKSSYGIVSFSRQITIPDGLEQEVLPRLNSLAELIKSANSGTNMPSYMRSDYSNFVRLTCSDPQFIKLVAPNTLDPSSFSGKVKFELTRGLEVNSPSVASILFEPGCLPSGIVRSAQYHVGKGTELNFSLRRLASGDDVIPWEYFEWRGFKDYISVSADNKYLSVVDPHFGTLPSDLLEMFAVFGAVGTFDFALPGATRLDIPPRKNSRLHFTIK